MRKSVFNIVIPFLLLSMVIGLGSCKKNREVKATITVLHDTIEPVGQDTAGLLIFDTITGPVNGAQVRMWSDRIGSLIDTTFETNSSGQADFEFDQVAILRMSVTFFSTEIDAGYVILEEGEVVEKTVNLDEF
ncbi:MAG: hypothetical protein ACI85F_000887 [Bacteroidia bacterium]|jgi:hypothetical protein